MRLSLSLSLFVSPQSAVPAMLFWIDFWRRTSQISCFLITWTQIMTAKVRVIDTLHIHKQIISIIMFIIIIFITCNDYLYQHTQSDLIGLIRKANQPIRSERN